MLENGDIKRYTIEVHALKSSSRQIGAMQLGEMAYELEKAGNDGNEQLIREKTPALLEKYRSYIPELQPFFEEKEKKKGRAKKKKVADSTLFTLFDEFKAAAEELDSDEMEKVSASIAKNRFEGREAELAEQLCEASSNIDVETCISLIEEWEKIRGRQ